MNVVVEYSVERLIFHNTEPAVSVTFQARKLYSILNRKNLFLKSFVTAQKCDFKTCDLK